MKRRDFLKMCGLLPLGASLAAVAASGAENKPPTGLDRAKAKQYWDTLRLRAMERSINPAFIEYPNGSIKRIPYRELLPTYEISQRYAVGTKYSTRDGFWLYVHKVKAMN